MKKLEKLILFILPIIILIIFKEWFSPGLISAGDFSQTQSSLKDLSLFPYSWVTDRLGYFNLPTAWLFYPVMLPTLIGSYLSIPWELTERIFLLYPLLAFLFIAPIFLFKKLFPDYKFFYISGLIFALNTYILMLIGGGQIYLALAYSISPLALYLFIKSFSKPSFVMSLILGLSISLQVMLDLRFAYITVISFLIYSILNFSLGKKYYINVFYSLLLPGAITFLIHAYWIIPTFLAGSGALQSFGEEYVTSGIIKFLSFAKFENTISLLHPNWPENIFGKTYFLDPTFLILPILAFSSLLFLKKTTMKQSENRIILFFSFLSLFGAFLAKGANEPFGGVYIWLFDHFPGFVMFRDPTKWYVLIALSYSILIPFTINAIYHSDVLKNIRTRIKLPIDKLLLLILIVYLLILIRPAILGQLTGTFKSTQLPGEYVELSKFLSSQNTFFRTLWIPAVQRYGFHSNNHPGISAHSLFSSPNYSNVLKNIRMNKDLFEQSSIKYIVVPFDSEGEIFLTDRIYDPKKYLATIKNISKIEWLKKTNCCGKIAVFEVPNPKDHFWSTANTLSINYQFINPTKYKVEVKNANKGDLIVFSESYNTGWEAFDKEMSIKSTKFEDRFNSFVLPAKGDYRLMVYYTPQDHVNIGLIISAIALIVSVGSLVFLKFKKK